ncbi:MAG: hypothetical protein H6942_08065 [Candidatus Accumulibacter sp.]|uniref:hypothetical protein n=1 Tax=Accumulibacter sp. TaxID=2053492 RepID=UPI0019F813C4|nr:hypothetical protein [Accumulibacter sp.]MBE2259779.1 hypothetical protein [Paracoccaceae bacterium]MCB1941172.1 hypothetical protein [Accumulibacter sp.]MCP5248480.1 hypothetical protein [Accumulibacter sp.]
MSKPMPPAKLPLARLRAAAGLLPIIEAALADGRLPSERAELMASFCEWTTERLPDDPEAAELASGIGEGLKRLRATLSAGA